MVKNTKQKADKADKADKVVSVVAAAETADSDAVAAAETAAKTASDDEASDENVNKLIKLAVSFNTLYIDCYLSYELFLNTYVSKLMEMNSVISETIVDGESRMVTLKFSNYHIRPPQLAGTNTLYGPTYARDHKISYNCQVVMDIEQMLETRNLTTGEVKLSRLGQMEKSFPISLPMMVGCCYCSTTLDSALRALECPKDPGCYFIGKGAEKVVISLENKMTNRIIITTKSNTAYSTGKMILGTIYSQKDDVAGVNYMQICRMFFKNDHTLIVNTPQFGDIPLVILLRAYGLTTDKEIMEQIMMSDAADAGFASVLLYSLRSATDANGKRITNGDEACEYIMSRIDANKIGYIADNSIEKQQQKRAYLNRLLTNQTLPHVAGGMFEKAKQLCLMAHKMIDTFLERRELDDQDAYTNKKVEPVGILMAQLFKMYWSKAMRDIRDYYRKQNNANANVIHKLRNSVSILEQGIRTSLATGNWGTSGKKGIAQQLPRLNYLQTVSSYRRIKTQQVEQNAKITSMRHVKSTQVGYLCYIETPEGASIGIVKNLAMSASITHYEPASNELASKFITADASFITHQAVHRRAAAASVAAASAAAPRLTRVLLDGDWIGYTSDTESLYKNLRAAKTQSKISHTTGIELRLADNELSVTTGAGRLLRPLLVVDKTTMKIRLTNAMVDSIEKDSITTLEEFMSRYPDVIELVPLEQQTCSLVATSDKDLSASRALMCGVDSATATATAAKLSTLANQRSKPYTPFDYRELHFCLTTGITVANIPFMNHNQAPRSTFQYSQARAANGIYALNYRTRFDNSFVLNQPERPLVYTMPMDLVGTSVMASGMNCIVAIMPFTGYNQEDSVIVNSSSVDRGLFVSTCFAKVFSEAEKNHATCLDDIYTKPNPDQISGMRNVVYSKLNQNGLIAEETVIEPHDAIIGKISPVPLTSDNMKSFRDSSTIYKGPTDAVIDKVQSGFLNESGYEMVQVRVRSERKPIIGDKFSSRAGQKGTCGLLVRHENMPFTTDGMVPDIIINENCLPSRMTIGQLMETVAGKVGALERRYVDGTSFQDASAETMTERLDELIRILGKTGYQKNGCEEMYSGMTGERLEAKIFIGPTYYQRLKHQVHDKIHARATGSKTMLVRQPPEGRQKDGGMRFGEMERDCMISHGMSMYLKERMVDCSDKYECHVCVGCGTFAGKKKEREVWYCKACDSTDTRLTQMPYAFKLMIQELMALNIKMGIRFDEKQ
jgi:DNA-directed RNA polymerase II subunit RPB2